MIKVGSTRQRLGRKDRSGVRPLWVIYIVFSAGIPLARPRRCPLIKPVTRVGRLDCDILMQKPEDLSVSRWHGTLSLDAKGGLWVRDQGSECGTFVDGAKLPPRSGQLVKDKAVLVWGDTIGIVRLETTELRT